MQKVITHVITYVYFCILDDVSVLLEEIMTEARSLTNAERSVQTMCLLYVICDVIIKTE
jgi:hypothetical protein